MSRRSFIPAIAVLTILALTTVSQLSDYESFPIAHALAGPASPTIAPSMFWGPFFGSTGDIQIDVNRTGIAVRVEIPREFLVGVITGENDTHFIESDIRNDYYYYNLVDESLHWTYGWKGNPSDGPCFKPHFSLFDPNAPWCLEIWNYLNGKFLKFMSPKFIRFRGLNAPDIAGKYNFTLFVADHNNSLGYPDFVHAFNKTLLVPVSMSDNPANLIGTICDNDFFVNRQQCQRITNTPGVVYARNIETNQIARAYVDPTGFFNLTGLASPGSYEIQASAGEFRPGGQPGWAFSLSNPLEVFVNRGDFNKNVTGGVIPLSRAPQLCGRIFYRNSAQSSQTNLPHPLADHPFLKAVGINLLNITVEGDDGQHVFRTQFVHNQTTDPINDTYRITVGLGVKYAGPDPYGTEFAGLPPNGTITLKFYITGYLDDPIAVSISPPPPGALPCNPAKAPNVRDEYMVSGRVAPGVIRFQNLEGDETPRQGEFSVIGTNTGSLFGGNILIQAFSPSDLTTPLGILVRAWVAARDANSSSILFYVIGFNEYYNRTWTMATCRPLGPKSCPWPHSQEDYGLQLQSYTLKVYIRGYEQSRTVTANACLTLTSCSPINVPMIRGGAIFVKVISFNNRFGTRSLQAEKPFRFLNLSIPVRARVYFFDSADRKIGYVECALVQGNKCGPVNGVSKSFFNVTFAGQDYSLREIWFYGFVPTHLSYDTYTVRAYTLGYVQQEDVSTTSYLTSLSRVFLALLIGNNIGITAPVFAQPEQFWSIPEHDHVRAEAISGSGVLSAAVNGNFTNGTVTLNLPLSGFGGMVQNGVFTGQGHFFYVAPDGTVYLDSGLDLGTYTADIPEFGFEKHFMQTSSLSPFSFNDLFQAQTGVVDVIAMGKVIQGARGQPDALVAGWIAGGQSVNETIPLSWVEVKAVGGMCSVGTFRTCSVPTLDGRFDGKGALFLPAGSYNITFSVVFYDSQSLDSVPVDWNSTYSILPPFKFLCPTYRPFDTSVCRGSLPAPPSPMRGSAIGFPLAADIHAQLTTKLSKVIHMTRS